MASVVLTPFRAAGDGVVAAGGMAVGGGGGGDGGASGGACMSAVGGVASGVNWACASAVPAHRHAPQAALDTKSNFLFTNVPSIALVGCLSDHHGRPP